MQNASAVGFAAVWLGLAAGAAGQTATATLSAGVAPLARLSISVNSLTFPDSDPDLMPQVPAAQGPVSITAKARASQNAVVMLTVQATDNLRSGTTVLPASLITWTGSGPGFVAGTLNATVPQTVASWTGSGARTGTQSYQLDNRWTHPTGTYSVTLVYILSAP